MSNHRNHRRGESYRTEHGPRWENGDPGAGCNSSHVARARRKWRDRHRRLSRRRFNQGLDLTENPPQPTWMYNQLSLRRKGQGLSIREDETEV